MNEGREGGENVDVHRVNKGSRKVRKGGSHGRNGG
jgi:hypothetical protein